MGNLDPLAPMTKKEFLLQSGPGPITQDRLFIWYEDNVGTMRPALFPARGVEILGLTRLPGVPDYAATFRVMLPHGRDFLDHIEPGPIEVRYVEAGNPSNPTNGIVVLRLYPVRVVRRRAPLVAPVEYNGDPYYTEVDILCNAGIDLLL